MFTLSRFLLMESVSFSKPAAVENMMQQGLLVWHWGGQGAVAPTLDGAV